MIEWKTDSVDADVLTDISFVPTIEVALPLASHLGEPKVEVEGRIVRSRGIVVKKVW